MQSGHNPDKKNIFSLELQTISFPQKTYPYSNVGVFFYA
jgi:hypothetical protein